MTDESPPVMSDDSNPAALSLPIEQYVLSPQNRLMVHRAHDLLVQECMASLGFAWEVPARQMYSRVEFLDRRYGLVHDLATARTHGYHTVLPDDEDLVRQRDEPSESELKALTGGEKPSLERAGCLGNADNQLMGTSQYVVAGGLSAPPEVTEVNFESYGKSMRDTRVLAAFSEWSTCMAENGYQTPNPVTDPPEGVVDMQSDHPSDSEIRMAVSDVECQISTNVVRIWNSVEAEIQEELIDANAGLFSKVAAENEHVLTVASSVVASRL